MPLLLAALLQRRAFALPRRSADIAASIMPRRAHTELRDGALRRGDQERQFEYSARVARAADSNLSPHTSFKPLGDFVDVRRAERALEAVVVLRPVPQQSVGLKSSATSESSAAAA